MKEIITINYNNEQPTVSGRDLHEALEVKTAYKNWFPRMCEYGFDEGKDFNPFKNERVQLEGNRQVVREVIDHQLTIAMAKELCMLQRSEKGKEFRKYFITVEEQWNTPEAVMARALQFANRQLESIKSQNIQLTETVTKLQNVNDVLAEKQLEWTDTASLSRLVRLSVHKLKCTYANLWTRLHNELLYKHHINLKARQAKNGNVNTSLISFLRDDEYKHAFSSLLAIFKYSGLTDVEINELLQKSKNAIIKRS